MKRLLFTIGAVLFAREAFAEKLTITHGQTGVCADLYVQNSSTGAGLPGVAWNAGGLACWYHRNTASASAQITLAAGSTLGTWASGMWREVDATNLPGAYQLCFPDAMFAGGATNVIGVCRGATNMSPVPFEFALTPFPTQVDGVVVGLPTPTAATFALASGQNSNRVNQQVCFTPPSALAGQCRIAASQNGTTTTFSPAFSAAPAAGDPYTVGGVTSSGSGGSTAPVGGQTTP